MVFGRRNAGDSLTDCATACPLNRVSTASAAAVVKDAFKTLRRFTINFRGFVWAIALSLRPLDGTGTKRAQVDTQRQWFLRPRPRRSAPMSAARRGSQSAGSFRATSTDQLRLFEPEGLCRPSPVGRIRARAIVDVPLLDVQLGVAHRPRRVLAQQLLLRRRHLPEQISRLFPMIVVDAVVP